ncbi:MAG: hypothetical protein Q7T40_07830 [Methylobacter sp.]|nr:hypothetical protein [Methylobacter sp.]
MNLEKSIIHKNTKSTKIFKETLFYQIAFKRMLERSSKVPVFRYTSYGLLAIAVSQALLQYG